MVVHLFGGYTTVSCGSSKNTKKTTSKNRPLGSGDVSGLVGTATVSNQHTVYMIQPSNASTTTTTTATATVPLTRNSASRAPRGPRGRVSATNKRIVVNSQAKSIAPRKPRAPSSASLSSSAVSVSASKAPRLLPGVEALGHGCVLCLSEGRVFSSCLVTGAFCTSAEVVSFLVSSPSRPLTHAILSNSNFRALSHVGTAESIGKSYLLAIRFIFSLSFNDTCQPVNLKLTSRR
jgi:hypothetical protein